FTYTITDANGATDTATVYITVAVQPSVQIALVKTGVFEDTNQNQCSNVDETIIYTFTVTNEGNEPLSNITLTDPLFEAPNPSVLITFVDGDTNNDNILDLTETWIYTAIYTITQNDIDNGSVSNQATVSGSSFSVVVTDLSDDNLTTENDTTVTALCNNASVNIVKVGVFNNENGNQCSEVGETITYTITVTNPGNTSLENVVVTDSLLDNANPAIPLNFISGDTDNDNELDPTETWIYSADYPVTETDVTALEVDNTAIVNAVDVANGGNVDNMVEVTTDLLEDTTPPDATSCEPLDDTIECDSDNNETLADAWNSTNITTIENCATENCTTFTVTSNYQYSNLVAGCGNTGTIDVIYTLTDLAGNSSTVDATLTIVDTTAPVIATLPDESTINCPSEPVFAEATAEDACSDFELTFEDVRTEGDCAGEYSITRTWTATDVCGNSSTASQTINVVDVDAPVFNDLPAETTISCTENPQDVFVSATATDACAGVTLSFNDVRTDGNCPSNYSITRTWTAVDACGNISTASQTVNVVDSEAPVFDALPDATTINCPATPEFAQATATDACGSDFELTFEDVRTDGNCAGEYSITRIWTATDTCGNTSTATQTINVVDVDAPVFDALPDTTTINCPATPEFAQATAIDACGSDFELTFEDVRTDGNCAGEYSVTRTWTATDTCGNTSTATQTINVVDVDAPVFDALPETTVINCPATPEFAQAIATDACGSDFELTFEDVRTDGNCTGEYSVTRTWTATDTCGNTSTATQTINVVDVDAPVFDALPETTVINCPATPEFAQAIATDACGSDFELTFEDVRTDGNCAGEYSVTRTWTATDTCGNTSTTTQTINVVDETAPEITVPADVTLECSDDLSTAATGEATATDSCSSNVSITSNDVTTAGDCDGAFTITRTWTATDECGNSATGVQTINVIDTTAPEISVPADATVECSDDLSTINTGEATATDNCSQTVEIIFTDATTPGDCEGSFIITRTWTATDSCGNVSSDVQTINVNDTTAPQVTDADGSLDVTVECSDADALNDALSFEPTATDNCSTDITLNLVSDETVTDASCPNASTRTRTWTFTDACGNVSEPFIQTISIVDTTAPILLTTFDQAITVDCDAIPEIPELQFEDNCSSTVNIDFTEEINFFTDTDNYEIIRVWTVDDGCGNITIVRQIILVATPTIIAEDGDRCIDDGVIDLFDFLQPNVDTSGTWSIVIGNTISIDNNLFNPQNGGEVGETYTFRYSLGEDCNAQEDVNITLNGDCIVLPCGKDDVQISNTVTANGDGVNEAFTISGVETCGFVYEVEIYNRWGAVIYKNSNYQNDWRGQTIGSSVGNSNNVPTGTYYYIVRLRNSGLEPFAGPLYIMTGN
ncbi:gliding motility-associated C-terminal domain-containing protein, partial [Winogradskyella litorisediminis]